MSKARTLEKIRAVIYNYREGSLNEEESINQIIDIMQFHYGEKLRRRE